MAYAWTHEFLASYEQAQSCLRLSMLCRAMVRPVPYPLYVRIVEFALVLDINGHRGRPEYRTTVSA